MPYKLPASDISFMVYSVGNQAIRFYTVLQRCANLETLAFFVEGLVSETN